MIFPLRESGTIYMGPVDILDLTRLFDLRPYEKDYILEEN